MMTAEEMFRRLKDMDDRNEILEELVMWHLEMGDVESIPELVGNIDTDLVLLDMHRAGIIRFNGDTVILDDRYSEIQGDVNGEEEEEED